MTKLMRSSAATLVALTVMSWLADCTASVFAAELSKPPHGSAIQIYGDHAAKPVTLGVGKGMVIDLPGDIKDVLVADPKIANAVVRTSRRAYLIGVAVGQTNIFFFDADGRQMMGFDVAVTRDLNGIRAALKRSLPGIDISVDGVADGIMLSGTAGSPAEAQQAFDVAARLAGSDTKVVNGITVRGRDQVMLKVTVAEVQRDVIKQLGIDLGGTLSHGQSILNLSNGNPFPVYGQALVKSNIVSGTFRGVTATLRAMERAGVIRTLAEPNLTAISGESANFLAGGEFPIPAGYTCTASTIIGQAGNCQYQIQWKKFGVGLNFTPVVLSEGRISLRGLGALNRLSVHSGADGGGARHRHPYNPVDQDTARGNHGRDPIRRLAGDGRHDP
jgi:pilus assembly protein CpaC